VKKILSPLIMLLLAIPACLPVLTPVEEVSTEPPIAYIDSISSSRIFEGETVQFIGHGVAPDGYIVAYSWRSSLDGVLSTLASFETSSLSTGRNNIYFKVQDNNGEWSKEKYQFITVIPEGSVKPIINKFEPNLASIMEGESTVLMWDVSGAKTVSIEPGIGDVPVSGSRTVYPDSTIWYTLTASNEAGDSTLKIEVKLRTKSGIKIETSMIPAESGHVRYTRKTGLEPIAGDTEANYAVQAFLSFDISMIPKGSFIKSASLDLTNMNVSGSPFTLLGSMAVYSDDYDEVDGADYVYGEDIPGGYPGPALIVTYTQPIQPYSYAVIAETIQSLVDEGKPRFKIRVQFERNFARDRQADLVEFIPGRTALTVVYEE
jgi:hypothetical protein